jgi:nucleoside-diphosphate-sugar epimerase
LVGAALEVAWKITGRHSEPPMTRFLAAQLATDHYFDIGRARRDLGYAATISTDEGMRRLGAWLKTADHRPVGTH